MEEELKEIDDLEDFLLYVKTEAFKVFLVKMISVSVDIYKDDDVVFKETEAEFIEKRLDDLEILKDLERYIIDGENEKLYIYREDAVMSIASIANDMLGKFLNNLVDADVLQMCWDSNNDEFIWRTKI